MTVLITRRAASVLSRQATSLTSAATATASPAVASTSRAVLPSAPCSSSSSSSASSTPRLFSTTAIAQGKSRPGEGKDAVKRRRRAARNARLGEQESEMEKEREFYTLQEAVEILKAVEVARPFSSFEVHLVTSITTHQSNALRGRLTLPLNISTRPPRLLIFAADGTSASDSARAYAASHPHVSLQIGGTDLVQAVVEGSASGYDKVLASPEMMPALSRALARSLGPKGLMPNAKRGTLAESGEGMREAIGEALGAVDWRGDKQAVVRGAVARTTFTLPEVRLNLRAFIASVLDRATTLTASGSDSSSSSSRSGSSSSSKSRWMTLAQRPDGERPPPDAVKRAKAVLKQVHISSTMGPGVKLPVEEVM